MSIAYCNSAEEIRSMIAKDEVFASALKKATEQHNYWMTSFADDASRLSGWGHNYVCPECAGHMKMDHNNYNPGGEYVCRNCGKTGTGRVDGQDVNGWFIGYIETADNAYFFATNIGADSDATGGNATEITMSILSDMNIWK